MDKLSKVIFSTTGTVTATTATSASGTLNLPLGPAKELGGDGKGVNPEELFAAGYGYCFLSAMKFVAGKEKIDFPADASITSTVGFGPLAVGFGFSIEHKISLPGMDKVAGAALIEKAHHVCPYSNATRGNIEVILTLV